MTTQTRRFINTLAVATVLALSACNISINPVSTGALRNDRIDIPLPAADSSGWEVELDPGAASVDVSAGGNNLVSGTVEYNVDEWKPIVTTSGHNSTIRQKEFSGIPPANARNDWTLSLGQGVPLTLTVNAGAIHGRWELGGLSMRAIHWKQGAADTKIRFGSLNPEVMRVFNIETGASSLTLDGLANINAEEGNITIGAGTLLLRFDGTLQRDLQITLQGGAAAVTVDPGNNPVQIVMGQKFATVTSGDWTQFEDTYNSPGWDSATGHKVTVKAELGAASLNLVNGK